AAVRRDGPLRHRSGAAPRPGRPGPAPYPPAAERDRPPGHGAGADCARLVGRRRARPVVLLLRSRLRARPRRAGPRRAPRRGGEVRMVIDNDAPRSPFGEWFRRGYPDVPDPETVERFWSTHGWTRTPVDMGWRFASRADLEAVVRIEFDRATADDILERHEG